MYRGRRGALLTCFPPETDHAAIREAAIEEEFQHALAMRGTRARLSFEAEAVLQTWNGASHWQRLVAAGAMVPPDERAGELAMAQGSTTSLRVACEAGTPLAALPDALGVLMELWQTGYAVQSFDKMHRVVVLVAPPDAPTPPAPEATA